LSLFSDRTPPKRPHRKSLGRRPVKVTLPESETIELGLLLFTSFIVRQLAVNGANNASAGTTAAMSGSYSG
jgi:hypothetical protein